MKKNTLYYGDCLEVMAGFDDRSVDLIYLDPPFNSKANYNILFGTERNGAEENDLAQMTAFTDTWEWDENAEKRVDNIARAVDHPAHRAIRAFGEVYPDGSGMLSYLSYMAERIGMMSRLLKDTGSIYLHCDPTASHYLKIIMDEVFGRRNFRNEIAWLYGLGGSSKRFFSRKHDVIFFFSKSDRYYFDKPLMASTSAMMGGKPKGMVDYWDIPTINNQAKERLGYPTQKPLELLKRIVSASCKKGGLVLDPFCGCGTTIEAAHLLKRDWIGIDISAYAVEVVRRERMKNLRINLDGVPKDLKGAADFAKRNPFDFEKWAVTRIPGFAPNTVQHGDGGIDGRARIFLAPKKENLCVAQVKGGAPHIDALRAFSGMIAAGKVAAGVFITLEKWDTPSVKKCVSQAGTFRQGSAEFNRLVMYSIDEHFQGIDPKLPALAHPRTGEALQSELSLEEDSPGKRPPA